MTQTRTTLILSMAALGAMAAASDRPLDLGDLNVTYAMAPCTTADADIAVRYEPQVAAAAGAALAFIRPKFGVRIGGGQWNDFVGNAGLDVTWKVPFIPLPALRLDGEVWGSTSDFSNRHGNALSLLGVETFIIGYAGIGPSYYFTDLDGAHKSGWGAKGLVGFTIPGGYFVEGGLILGPSPVPVFVDIGMRF